MRRLWRGETVQLPRTRIGNAVAVVTLPRPVQPELPIWVTTAGNPETFRAAGRARRQRARPTCSARSIEELAAKIAVYREARAEAGLRPGDGHRHADAAHLRRRADATVRELVREPLKDYLRTSVSLIKHYAWAFPAFKQPAEGRRPTRSTSAVARPSEELDALLEYAFERYYETSGLFGTPETCLAHGRTAAARSASTRSPA